MLQSRPALRSDRPIRASGSKSPWLPAKDASSTAARAAGRLLPHTILGHWAAVAGLVFTVGYSDRVSGTEISFSIFYLLPVAYATWFLEATAGFLTALVCAIVWGLIETASGSVYSQPWIPVWNGAVRMVFFGLGVGVVVFAHRTKLRLLGEVANRTERLLEESLRRQRLEREMGDLLAQEQVRLAHDLHDGLGQYMSALTFQTRMLADDLAQERSHHASQAERMMELIRKTNQITRQLDRTLRVPDVGAGGLLAAVRALAVEFEQLTGVRCEVEAEVSALQLDEFHTLMLFRIAQEAFSNAVKHANPSVIRARLAVAENTLRVSVVDDGQPVAKPAGEKPGSGLRIMAMRAELIGAQLHAAPTADSTGFAVECIVPLTALKPHNQDCDHHVA